MRATQDATTSFGELRVYGVDVSYFTGKLEAYLRYKQIPYRLVSQSPGQLAERAGAAQVPAAELPDGRFMTDSTPMIAWFESQHPAPAVIPEDPLQAFVCRLVEDYADEWLWRPAMHYRWSYAGDRALLSRHLVDTASRHISLPRSLKRLLVRRRQLHNFVRDDGVDEATWDHVEGSYLRALDLLGDILEHRPFLLGERPTLADFGMMGPMFRHFSHDPTPAAIMVERAPAVWEWVARVWNARASRCSGPLEAGIPDDWQPLLREICETHGPNLVANAIAWKQGHKYFAATIQGVHYARSRTSRYRVWCLEQLRGHYAALPSDAAREAKELLDACGGFAALEQPHELGSGYDPQNQAPFGVGLEVLTEGMKLG